MKCFASNWIDHNKIEISRQNKYIFLVIGVVVEERMICDESEWWNREGHIQDDTFLSADIDMGISAKFCGENRPTIETTELHSFMGSDKAR